MKNCLVCNHNLHPKARFCYHCGARIQGMNYLNFDNFKTLKEDIKMLFLETLNQRLAEEQDPKMFKAYSALLFHSNFFHQFEVNLRQWTEEAQSIYLSGSSNSIQQIDLILAEQIDRLLDQFLLIYCRDLNVVDLPESILKYQAFRDPEKINLLRMILDFLDLENAEEPYYADFLRMPPEKLKNAARSFVHASKDELILLICDQSVTNTFREGFAFSNKALYWKVHFQKPRVVPFSEIQILERRKNWIEVNGMFFHANKEIDVRMFKLLKKLKKLYAYSTCEI